MLKRRPEQQIDAVIKQHEDRLRSALQYASRSDSGPEKGSDAWLLLNALVTNDRSELDASFEQSGRALAQQGGKLEARLLGLQTYIDTLGREYRSIFGDDEDGRSQQHEAIAHLNQLHSLSLIALTRGYQSVVDQVFLAQQKVERLLERRLQALQRINSISNSAIDLDQSLEAITRHVADELRVDLCSVFFYDEMQRVLTLRATNGPRPMGGMHYTLRLGEGYSGWVADKGSPVLARDALSNAAFASEARSYGQEYAGLMSLPIIFFGNVERLIGVINVQTHEPRDFSGEEMNFVEVVAGTIAINVENGRLYEETDEHLRRKVHELATLHRVSSIIASTLDLDRVLQIITTQAVQLSGADRSCIFELNEDRRCLGVIAHYGLNSTDAQGIQIPVGHCCAGRAVQTGRPSMAVDCFYSDEQCLMHKDPLASAEMHSVLCVPLQVKQTILGCICIYSSHRHMLSQEQLQLVITFANEAAIAIDNARLFEEARRGLEIKTTLLRELHHRVKNNLATVAGILSLQRRRTRSAEVRYILAESVNRVQGLAATHDLLSHDDVSEARVDDIARKIVGVANANLRPPQTHIDFEVKPCPVVIPARAVEILALVLNEMVSNAIKHGINGQPRGAVSIRGREERGEVIVEVLDTGSGPAGPLEEESSEGLGLSLIKNLMGDLGGSYILRRTEEMPSRTCAEVRFPLKQR